MNAKRIYHLMKILVDNDLHAVAFNPGSNLAYLTGLNFHLSERPIVLIISQSALPLIVLPELEAPKLQSADIQLEGVTYTDNPETWQKAFIRAAKAADLSGKKVAVDENELRVLELQLLESAAQDASFVSFAAGLSELRICKEEAEIDFMRQAAVIAEGAFEAIQSSIIAGITEKELAAELTLQLYRHGSDTELPFQLHVSSGENSANPHAMPTDRRLQNGDLVIFDWGARYHGYCSDITRTIAVGDISDELKHVYEIVLQANLAGRDAACAGIPAGEVDKAARAVIEKQGYGDYFIHRLGHGLGLQGHEPPYLFSGSEKLLRAGMTHTIEPGIYLPGVGGVRIEDDVVITETGCRLLTSLDRSLHITGR